MAARTPRGLSKQLSGLSGLFSRPDSTRRESRSLISRSASLTSLPAPAAPPGPPPSDREFIDVLNTIGVPEATQAEMLQYSDAKKREIMGQYAAHRTAAATAELENARAWVGVLRRGASAAELSELAVVLSGAHVPHIKAWEEAGGISATARILVHLTARARRTEDEWDRLARALDCLGALARTKSGLEALIDEPWSARALACGEGSLLMCERIGPLSTAIGLLSAMAVYSAVGHNRVRAAVADLSASRFSNGGGARNGGGALRALVELLRPPRRPAQQYALQLVNALVSGPDDIGVRVQVTPHRLMPC